jgi:hypothetical protein
MKLIKYALVLLGLVVVIALVINDKPAPAGQQQTSAATYTKAPPIPPLIVKDLAPEKTGFGVVLVLGFITIHNPAKVAAKDFTLVCDLVAPSGTKLQTIRHTVYDTIGPGKTRTFENINMGFAHVQASNVACGAKR